MVEDKDPPPLYHLRDLFPDQRAMIAQLGDPVVVGSHETAIYLVNPQRDIRPLHYRNEGPEGVIPIGPSHAVMYTCPVVMVLGRPRMVLPNGDLQEVDILDVADPLPHWN